MSFGKFLKKLVPVAQTAGTIAINASVGNHMAATLVRQLVLLGASSLASKGVIGGDQVETVTGAVLALGTVAYGQLKARKDKVETIALAVEAPNGEIIARKPPG